MTESTQQGGAGTSAAAGTSASAGATDTDALLNEWADALRSALGITDLEVDIREVLSLAGLAAHGVVRPAAPLTTFLVGYAAGAAAASGSPAPSDAVAAATAAARRLVREHTVTTPRT
jgi:hypothetical protein